MQRLGEMQILNNHVDINNNKKKTAEKPVSCVTEKLWLTWWLEEPPLPFNLPLLPTAVALLRRACSWSNSRSSRRWVKASFCWMAIRNREFRVFFSSSAAASCLCMSSSWVTYSSHLRENQVKREEKKKKKTEGRDIHLFQQVAQFAAAAAVTCFLHSLDSSFQMGGWLPRELTHKSITSDSSHNALCLSHRPELTDRLSHRTIVHSKYSMWCKYFQLVPFLIWLNSCGLMTVN